MTCDMMEWNTIATMKWPLKGNVSASFQTNPSVENIYIVFVSICEAMVGELVWLNGVGFRQTLISNMLLVKVIMTASKAVQMFPSVQKLSVL